MPREMRLAIDSVATPVEDSSTQAKNNNFLETYPC